MPKKVFEIALGRQRPRISLPEDAGFPAIPITVVFWRARGTTRNEPVPAGRAANQLPAPGFHSRLSCELSPEFDCAIDGLFDQFLVRLQGPDADFVVTAAL